MLKIFSKRVRKASLRFWQRSNSIRLFQKKYYSADVKNTFSCTYLVFGRFHLLGVDFLRNFCLAKDDADRTIVIVQLYAIEQSVPALFRKRY